MPHMAMSSPDGVGGKAEDSHARGPRFELAFPRDGTSRGTSRDKPGRDVPLSLCPGTRTFSLSRCPFVPGQGQEYMSRDKLQIVKTGPQLKKVTITDIDFKHQFQRSTLCPNDINQTLIKFLFFYLTR